MLPSETAATAHPRVSQPKPPGRTRGSAGYGRRRSVLKPFSFSELSARVRALLRRGGRSASTVLCMDDLELNRVEHSLKRAALPKYALAPNRLSASGYGQYYPVSSNATAEGRAMNRRVDLVRPNSNVESIASPTPTVISGTVQPMLRHSD